MKRIFSVFLAVALLVCGCASALSSVAVADTVIPTNALRVHHVNKVVASNQISVFTDYDSFVSCNCNGWGVYYQLRATENDNEYSVIDYKNNPGEAYSKGSWNFTDVEGDIYMQVNGGTANASVYNLAVGTTVTFINLTLAQGDYTDTYVYAGKAIMPAGELINNAIADTTLVSSVGNIQAATLAMLDSENPPANAFFDAAKEDFKAVFEKCIEKKVLPTVLVNSAEDVAEVIDAMNSCGCYDVNVISWDAEHLAAIREATNVARTGLVYELTKDTLTSKEAAAIRDAVRSAPATFVVIDGRYASKQNVSELQELGVAVWADVAAGIADANFNVDVIDVLTAGVNAILSCDSSAVTELINNNFAEKTMLRTPYIVGHRGNPSQVTENTLESFISAYENGADVIELDVYATTDGKVVIFHDYSLGTSEGLRLTTFTGTTAEGALQNMTSDQIRQYKYKTGENIAFLDEVFDYFKGKDVRIFVEFKGSAENTVKYTAQLIEEYDISDQIVVITSAGYFMEYANKYFENKMSLGYIYYPQLITNNSAWQSTDSMEECLEILASTLNIIQAWDGNLSPLCTAVANGYLGAAVANRGLVLNPWGYSGNTNNNIGFFSDVDSITTDDNQYFKDMAKYVTAEDISLKVRECYDGSGFNAITYGRETKAVDNSKIVYSVIQGDSVKVYNGKLYAVAEGESKIIMGYKTATTSGGTYVLYSEVVTVNVAGIDETLPEPHECVPDENDWYNDEENHWHVCQYGEVIDSAAHKAGAWETVKEAEVGVEGRKEQRCSVCGYLMAEEAIPALEPDEPIGLRGDVTKNGEIDSRDYVFLKRAYFGTYKLDDTAKLLADVTNNGEIDSRDYVFLKRAYFGTYKIPENIKYVYAE